MTQRNAYNRLSNHKTTVSTIGDFLTCIYVATPIVRYRAGDNPSLVLDSGGYETVTTKKKMNQFSHQYDNGLYGVYQKKRVWYVQFKGHEYTFRDGMDLFEEERKGAGKPLHQ